MGRSTRTFRLALRCYAQRGSISGNILVSGQNNCGNSTFDTLEVTVNSYRTISKHKIIDGTLQAFPNPTNGLVTLQFNSNTDSKYSITITDLTGRILFLVDDLAKKGSNLKQLDLSWLAKGTYLVNYRSDLSAQTIQILLK